MKAAWVVWPGLRPANIGVVDARLPHRLHMLVQMPPLFEGEATKELLKKQQLLAPLTIHLRQEIDRCASNWACRGWVAGAGGGAAEGARARAGPAARGAWGPRACAGLLSPTLNRFPPFPPPPPHTHPPTHPPTPLPTPSSLNKVIALVGGTLRDLRLAIAGTIALSDELAEALDALFNARVPKRWAKIRWVGGSCAVQVGWRQPRPLRLPSYLPSHPPTLQLPPSAAGPPAAAAAGLRACWPATSSCTAGSTPAAPRPTG